MSRKIKPDESQTIILKVFKYLFGTIGYNMNIRDVIQYGLDEAGYPNLKVKYEFNNRFTRRLGDANYFHHLGYGRIRLSNKLWPTMHENEQIDTVLHELAHVIDIYVNGHIKDNGGHGFTWKCIAQKIGARPERYARKNAANFAKFKRKTTRYLIPCHCQTYKITAHRYNKMVKGTRYRCKKCGYLLEYWRAKKQCV
jgi:predicted SprT family Zn-dependent metalloprotease